MRRGRAQFTSVLACALAVATPATANIIDRPVAANTGSAEPEVEVSTRDARTIVVGKNDSGVAVSHDGGETFRQIAIPNTGDAALAQGPGGTFFFTALDGDVFLSSDNGDTWTKTGNWVGTVAAQASTVRPVPGAAVVVREAGCSAPSPAGPVAPVPGQGPGVHKIGCDRPWLAADRITGTLYASFVDHDDNGGGLNAPGWELSTLGCKTSVIYSGVFECGRQYVSASHDAGRSWSGFRPFDSPDYPEGPTGGFSSGQVAAGGVLAVAYIAASAPGRSDCPCLVFGTSTDDGVTFTRRVVTGGVPLPPAGAGNATNVLGGEQSLLFEPYLAGDPLRSRHYAVMTENADMSKLLVWTTEDGGATWDGPAQLSDSFGTQRHLPWLAIGPSGALGAMWRSTTTDGSYTVWAAVARHGDADFDAPVLLSSAPSPGPVQALAGDDASDVTLSADALHAVWGDRRDGSLGDRYGRYDFRTSSAR